MNGIFITFEGGEGAGKSTVLARIKNVLEEEGKKVMMTREPGGIPISEKIRSIILDVDNRKMDERTEVLLYAAARRQHLVEKVIPALQEGFIVLCDRFIDSSLAYQGYARGIDIDEVLLINRFAIAEIMPDLTLYFDVSPEVGLSRVKGDEKREVNRLDLEALDFHHKVRNGYMQLLNTFSERITLIHAEQELSKVIEDTLTVIRKRIKN